VVGNAGLTVLLAYFKYCTESFFYYCCS